MAQGDVPVTIVGNIGRDPELRYTPAGQAVCSFSVGSTPRYMDRTTNEWKDGETVWLRCNIWRQAAENVAETLTKGTRVIVSGRLKQRSYEKDGQKHTVYECEADEVGVSLKNATAKVTKSSRSGSESTASRPASGGSDDPWASGSASDDTTPPF